MLLQRKLTKAKFHSYNLLDNHLTNPTNQNKKHTTSIQLKWWTKAIRNRCLLSGNQWIYGILLLSRHPPSGAGSCSGLWFKLRRSKIVSRQNSKAVISIIMVSMVLGVMLFE